METFPIAEMTFKGHRRSLVMTSYNRLHTTSYYRYRSQVTTCLSIIVCAIQPDVGRYSLPVALCSPHNAALYINAPSDIIKFVPVRHQVAVFKHKTARHEIHLSTSNNVHFSGNGFRRACVSSALYDFDAIATHGAAGPLDKNLSSESEHKGGF